MSRKFANILETIGNTPVVRIGKLAPPDVNLFVKIEAFNPLGSVKDRLALGVIEDAERTGKLKPGQTVIEATSGNTGIGLAMVCAQKGYPLVVTMAEPFSVERRRLMRFLGAKVVITPAAERGMGMVNKAIELAEAHGWFLTRQFENEANPDMHSRTTAREIVNDFAGERLDYWVTGFGTGGTLKGVARVLKEQRPQTQVIDLGGHFVMPGFNDAHLHLDDVCAGRHVDDARSSAFILRVADLYPVDVDERARGDAGDYDLGPVRHGLGSMKPAAARKQSQHDEKRFFQSTHPAVRWIRA